jgi:hypothetical protein
MRIFNKKFNRRSFYSLVFILIILCLGQACSTNYDCYSHMKKSAYLDSSGDNPSNTELNYMGRITQSPQQPVIIIQNEQYHDNNQKNSFCCCCENCKFKCCGCECGCCCCSLCIFSGCLILGIGTYSIGAYAFHSWPTLSSLF